MVVPISFVFIAAVGVATALCFHLYYSQLHSTDHTCVVAPEEVWDALSGALTVQRAIRSDGEDAEVVQALLTCIQSSYRGEDCLQSMSEGADMAHVVLASMAIAASGNQSILSALQPVVCELSSFHTSNNGYSTLFSADACSMSWCAPTANESVLFHRAEGFLSALRSKRQHAMHTTIASPVLVIGAGPAGLLSALQARISGANVIVIEKRMSYGRDIWFDVTRDSIIGDSPLPMLLSWGYNYTSLPVITHVEKGYSDDVIVTIRCQTLERFLLRAAVILGVQFRFNSTVTAIECATATGVQCQCDAMMMNGSVIELESPYHVSAEGDGGCDRVAVMVNSVGIHHQYTGSVVIVADGGSSITTPLLQQTSHQTTITLHGDGRNSVTINQPGLHQVALLLRLHTNNTGHCPQLYRDEYGRVMEPFVPWLVDVGIAAVFKRFYEDVCEVQILLSNELGEMLVEQSSEDQYNHEIKVSRQHDRFAWTLIDRVVNTILDKQCDTLQCTQHIVQDATLLNMTILSSRSPLSLLVTTTRQSADHASRRYYSGLVITQGDANVNAFFRLGVGVNTLLANMYLISDALHAYSHLVSGCEDVTSSMCSDSWTRLQSTAAKFQAVTDTMIDVETTVMYREGYCHQITGPDGAVYESDKRGGFMEITDASKLVEPCAVNDN